MKRFLSLGKIKKLRLAKLNIILLFELMFVAIVVGNFIYYNATKPEEEGLKKDPKIEAAFKVISDCDQPKLGETREICYTKKLTDLAYKRGSKYTFEVFSHIQNVDPSTQRCHAIAHGIGSGAFKNSPKKWQQEVQSINPKCNYGAIHGVISSYTATLPGKRLTNEVVPTLCGENPRGDCNHIVGHLVLVEAQADIYKALDFCSVFQDTAQLHYCYAGAFMEYQSVDNLIEHGYATEEWKNLSARIAGIEKMCRSFTGEKEIACWEEIAYSAFEKYGEASKIFDFCNTSPIDPGALLCKRYALVLISVNKNFDIESLKEICQIPQSREPDFESNCYANLGASLLVTVPERAGTVVGFCGNLEKSFVQTCYSMIGLVLRQSGSLSEEQIKATCEGAPADYRSICYNSQNGSQSEPISSPDYKSTR